MFRNNLKLAVRTLLKNKSQSLILIGGLTVGMAACIMLLQYVSFELSFDDFHSKKDNIYRVVNQRFQNGSSVQKGTITYPTIGPTMKNEFPEVVNATRIFFSSDLMISKEDKVTPVEPGLWVDQHFFEIFDFPLLAKDGLNMLDETNEVVLSRQLADQYFPAAKGNYESILGEELRIDRYQELFKIVGVCEDVPANSLLQFEMLLSFPSAVRYFGEGADNSWVWSDFYHYLELQPGADPLALQKKFPNFSTRHFKGSEVSGSEEVFTLQPLPEAHLYSKDLEYEIGKTANGKAVWSLLIIAFFILLIAWVNYVNLSSVRAIERSKEVGVRKVIGATRSQLVRQFFVEAFLVNFISLLLALGAVQIFTPWFAVNFDVPSDGLSFFVGNGINTVMVLAQIGLILGGVLVSGVYPAWLLSSPHVSSVLKGVFSKDLGGAWLRKGLVIFQFTMSIALIIATWLVSSQINYMSKQDLGIDINKIMTINSPEMSQWDSTFIRRMNTFKKELAKFPGINSAATSNRAPGDRMGRVFQIRKSGEGADGQTFTSNFINADFEYAKTYGMEPLAGRFFREGDHHQDFARIDKIVLTEAAVKMLGYESPESALQQQLSFWDKSWRVIGVVPDFHQRSLQHGIEPILFIPSYSTYNLLSLNVNKTNIEGTLAHIKETYEQFFPGNHFQYAFLDRHFQQLYDAEERFSNILSFFTFLTIFIACLGLFGLASYTTFLRTKEIGVRKILGASAGSIVALLSKDFLKLVAGAIVIASPIAWYVMNLWLSEFAFRIDIHWWVFGAVGIITIMIAFLTVSFQSVKAAFANPVKSLRSE